MDHFLTKVFTLFLILYNSVSGQDGLSDFDSETISTSSTETTEALNNGIVGDMTYINGGTYLTLQRDLQGNVTGCVMARIGTPEKKRNAIANFTANNQPFQETNFYHMLSLMRECDAAVREENEESIGLGGAIFRVLWSPRSFFRGIVPGTKWCGKGKLANGWDDLGPQKGLDRCCRTHDHCPRKIKAKKADYGLNNDESSTKSHCECDSMFYDCLKQAEETNRLAWLVGKTFFNQLEVKCFEEQNPPNCIEKRPLPFQSCLKWEEMPKSTVESFVFKEVKKRY